MKKSQKVMHDELKINEHLDFVKKSFPIDSSPFKVKSESASFCLNPCFIGVPISLLWNDQELK